MRGVQVYGESPGQALAGQRTALNLADIEPAEIARGMVLAAPGRFRAVTQIGLPLDLLASAKPLKHRAPVHFHSGTAEIEAQVRLLEGGAALRPGERAWVRIVLREPALLLPGDRFIVRMFSPVVTIGGGRWWIPAASGIAGAMRSRNGCARWPKRRRPRVSRCW